VWRVLHEYDGQADEDNEACAVHEKAFSPTFWIDPQALEGCQDLEAQCYNINVH
jgi:hypothetical protein